MCLHLWPLVAADHSQLLIHYPARACAARGYVIGRGVYIIIYILLSALFWNQTFIFQNTHFQRSILTQIGFSSNLTLLDSVASTDAIVQGQSVN